MAPWISQDRFILAVVGGLLVWAALSGALLYRAQRKLRAALDRASRLVSSSGDALAFAASFETVNDTLGKDGLIGASWRGFSHSLIVPELPERPVLATTDPSLWFDLARLFRKSGADLRYHAALPGMLVGCGLLFTFLGLAAGLAAAGDVVAENVTQSARNAALRDLLGAASVKFITSLFGLGFSIAYALWRKHMLRQAERSLDRLLAALHRVLPFKSTAFLQTETNRLLGQQFGEIQRIGTDFFVNLGATLEKEFSSGLEQHLSPLAASLDKLSERLGGQNDNAVQTMMDAFLKRLEGAVGENMRQMALTLDRLGARLDGLQGGLDQAAARMSLAAEEMARGMGRGAEDALGGITQQISALVATLRDAAEEAGRTNRAAGADLARQTAEAAASLAAAVGGIRERLEQGAADGVGRLTGPIEALLVQLKALTDSQRQAGQAAADDLSASIERAAKALEATADRVAGDFGDSAATASARIGDATAAVGASLEAAASRLAVAGEAAGDALRTGGADARTELTEGGRIVSAGSQVMADQMTALATAANALGDRAAALDAAARQATPPLAAAAADLRAVAEANRQAAEPLAGLAQAARLALEGLSRAATTMESAQAQASTLATRLGEATDRFAGLDQALGKTTDVMAQGIDEMARRLTDFVRGMDNGLAKNVDDLNAIARSLENACEELASSRVLGE